jgi:uncharacterized protein
MVALVLVSVLAASPPAETVAQAFLSDLREGRADRVTEAMGPKLKAAITSEKLVEAWQQAATAFGALKTLEPEKTTEQQGMTVLTWLATFERGALKVTTVVNASSKIEGFFMKPAPATTPPQTQASYVTPEAFGTFDVKVGKAPFELGGTLTVPKGKGPFPAVVLVHGSGPNDRDETIGANKVFKDLAEGLSSKGVAVLRYDKRTFTYGAQLAGKEITFDDEVIDDAVAALALLAARTEVDAKKLFLVGHSLGALFAPAIAKKANVAGVVCLAPSSRKPWDILSQQMKYLGVPSEKIAELDAAFAEIKSGKKKTGTVLNAPVSYWRAWAAFDGPGLAKTLKVPVLVLHGSRDYQVIEADLDGWKKALAGVKTASVVELPGLNHLFIAGDGPSTPKEYETPLHVAPEVVERLIAFCR